MNKKLLLIICLFLGISGANAQTYLTEDFEGVALPAGWGQVTAATDGGWNFGVNSALQSANFPIAAHTNIACTNDDACNCDKSNDIIYTSSIDLSAATYVFCSYDCYYYNLTYQAITETATIVVSTDGGTTWTDVVTVPANTGSWQTNTADLSAYAGNADVKVGFKYSDQTGWLYGWAIDNVSIYAPPVGVDLAVSSTIVGKDDPTPAFVAYPKYIANLPLQVSTTVTNNATVPVTSFDYSWTDGVNTYNQSFTGLNIAPVGTYSFISNNPYNTMSGSQTITSTVSNINGGVTELNTTNNIATYDVQGVTPNPDMRYFAEEATGTWCGWCPRGAVFMEYMKETYPGSFVGVAVHNADPMTVTAYDAGIGAFPGFSGYPSVIVNRTAIIDPSQLEGDFIDYISNAPAVVITGTATLNSVTHALSVDVTGTFSQNLSGDYRFLAIVEEDSVHATTSTYAQNNYYTGNAQGPMGGFESLPASVPAAQMYYEFVGRALLGGFGGQTGSLPGTITSGSAYPYQFTSTAAATWNPNKLSVAVVVIETSTNHVLNAASFPVTVVSGIQENSSLSGSYIYPTATNDVINLSLTLANTEKATVIVTDVLGKEILNQNLGVITKGEHQMQWNVNSLAAGVYNLNVQTSSGLFSQKFVKN
ncbi:MAG: Omp28-related outer membrane protein [Bacteroidia bacterium]